VQASISFRYKELITLKEEIPLVNTNSLINYNRDDPQLEHFFLRCLLVAGKNATVQQNKLDRVLGSNKDDPFGYLFSLDYQSIISLLKGSKTGQYKRIANTITHLKCNNIRASKLRDLTLKELEEIPGIGPKTARFFAIYSRENQQVAVLDTHILAWMRENGHEFAPRSTPSTGRAYALWETKFLWECGKRNKTPVELDNIIWKEHRQQTSKGD